MVDLSDKIKHIFIGASYLVCNNKSDNVEILLSTFDVTNTLFLFKRGGIFKVEIDNNDCPIEDNYFNTVFAGEPIEHDHNPDHFLDEVHRILKKKLFLQNYTRLSSLV